MNKFTSSIAQFRAAIILALALPTFGGNVTMDSLNRNTRTERLSVANNYSYSKSGNRLSRVIESPYRHIHLEVAGAPGTVTGGGIAAIGSILTLSATPATSSDLADWSQLGNVLGTTETLQYTIPNDASATTTITARFIPGVPASISTSPTPQTVNAGSATTLATTVAGTGTITHQWFRNGVAIPGATSPSLILPAASFNDAGQYTLRVSNRHGTAESTPSLLSIRMTGYDQWKNAVFTPAELTLNDPLTVGPSAILDGQKPNLLHYAFGLRARDFVQADTTTQWLELNGADQYFKFRYRHLLGGGGLRYTVSISDDLLTWDDTEAQIEYVGTPTPNNDGLTENVSVRLKTPITPSVQRKFVRLSLVPQ